MHPNLYALGAIALWATLASLGVALRHVPPFLLTGLALVIGSVPAWPLARQWKVPPPTLALGIYGLFGYHLLLFIALRLAPPVEANLVNYLWPLLIVVLAPLFLPGLHLRPAHVLAALAGFAGAAVAILGGRGVTGGWSWGYLPALGSALIWASYSLGTRRVPAFPTAAIGPVRPGVGPVVPRVPCLLEPSTPLSLHDGALIAAWAWARSARRSSCGTRRSRG
jgi:drug/metabolite transporter (DMT)-like permease